MRTLSLVLFLGASHVHAQSQFSADVEEASVSDEIRVATKDTSQLIAEGRLTEANARLLAAFPATNRTTAQSSRLLTCCFDSILWLLTSCTSW